MKLQTLIFCFLFFTITVEIYGQGIVINDSFYSTFLNETRMVDVYLPECYYPADTTQRYPVVYFLHGAGPQTAQKLFDLHPDILITGNGPGGNAAHILEKTGMKIYIGAGDMTVQQAYNAYKNNELKEA